MSEKNVTLISKNYAENVFVTEPQLQTELSKKQDNVGLSIGDDGNVVVDMKGITQDGGPFENFFDGFTHFNTGVEIQGKKPVLDVTSQDGSVTVTRSSDGYGVDLKAKSGGSTDSNPRFRIVTWNINDSMASFGKLPARPEDATFGNITLEQFNSGCQSICPSAFAVALNEYTWLVTRGEGMWNDNDFGVFCWSGLKHTKDDYECHYCDLPESTLPL